MLLNIRRYILQIAFDQLIDSYISREVGISDHFLSESLALHLKANLVSLYSGDQLRAASVGNDQQIRQNSLVRGDKIFWLDRAHGNDNENQFFDLMDSFVSYLNSSCYTGITGYEFHYTLYEKGSFYKRHLDQFRDNDSRQYSMVMYLNDDWHAGDGGELRIYQHDGHQNVAPVNRKAVFFKSSSLEHEVLPVTCPRMSITGWLKCDPNKGAISVRLKL